MVVGAGVVGCAVAYELARRGASVEVIDDRPAGMGATQASAGVLAPFIEARHEGPLLQLTVRSLGLFDDFIARIQADSAAKLTYQRTGTLDVALDPDGLAVLVNAHERLTSQGIEANLLDGPAVSHCEPHVSNGACGLQEMCRLDTQRSRNGLPRSRRSARTSSNAVARRTKSGSDAGSVNSRERSSIGQRACAHDAAKVRAQHRCGSEARFCRDLLD